MKVPTLTSGRDARPVPFVELKAQHRALRVELLAAVERVLAGARFVLGPEVAALEAEIARRCGATHGVGVNSGTDALVLALRGCGLRPGDEVIVPAFSFIATASAVVLAGGVPVFADIEPDFFTLDPNAAAARVTRRTRAIVPVHLYGQSADMTALAALARRHRLMVIEDAAQALGATWRGRPVGALADAGCLSFFPTKNLGGAGDGGMIVTNRAGRAARLRRLRDHGAAKKYRHREIGWNTRLDEIQAAILRVKLPLLDAWNARRRSIAAAYDAGFRDLPGVVAPKTRDGAVHVYHQYVLRVARRDAVLAALRREGVGAAVHYPLTLPRQPALGKRFPARARCPEAERAAREVLCLPVAPEITDANVRRVIAAVRRTCGAHPGKNTSRRKR